MKGKMKISEHGCDLITKWEGFKCKVYKDVAGRPTIGVGHCLTIDELTSGKIFIGGAAVKYGDGLTDEQVKALLDEDLDAFEGVVNKLVRVPLSQDQFDALVSFTFNVGAFAFQTSTLLRRLNVGKYSDVPEQMLRWIYSGGKKRRGLKRRRKNEIKLWHSQI